MFVKFHSDGSVTKKGFSASFKKGKKECKDTHDPANLMWGCKQLKNIFDKNSADKIQSKNYKGGKSALPDAN